MIKSAEERKLDFTRDFNEMLKKHKADIDFFAESYGYSYGEYTGDATVSMMTEYDQEGNIVAEYSDFSLKDLL